MILLTVPLHTVNLQNGPLSKKGLSFRIFCNTPLLAVLLPFLIVLAGNNAARAVDEQAEAEELAVPRISLVRVHLPLTGNADQALVATISRLRDQLLEAASNGKDSRRPTLILELEPHQQDGGSSQFERAFSLARFLSGREMAGVKTVAFVPRSIQGHGSLLALACEELIMAPDATLGEAAINEEQNGPVGQTIVQAYREIAEARRTMPVALAIGMIDRSQKVLQVETENGTEFILGAELEKFAQQREIINENTLVPAGSMGSYEGREGRLFGFVKFLAADRDGLARALQVPSESIREDDQLAGQWEPIIIDLQGQITNRLVNQIETMITTSLAQGVNWIGLRIDSAGGDLAASVRLATTLSKLDENSVRTVAYVPSEATGGAAVIALACDQLVMHSEARLGASELPQTEDKKAIADRESELNAVKTTIRESLAPRAERSWSLLAAMIDPEISVAEYRNRNTGETSWISDSEAIEKEDAEDWLRGDALGEENTMLLLDGTKAKQAGLAWRKVESFDELKGLFQLTEDPPVAEPNWALDLIEALASPSFSFFLLLAGFAGLYLELRTPGIGVGAFVGSVALLLFFWSQYLHGTAGWLEVILFVAGICFILIEIFVLPGFGIFGLGGGAMVIASLVLASVTFVRPRSEQDLEALSRSMGMVALAGVGMIALTLVSRRYLPDAPLFRRIVLDDLPPEEQELLEKHEMLADFSDLIGLRGVAKTHLRPSGKAEIDHQLLDVIAESEPLDRGTPVVVVEAQANRVIVRAVGPA